MPTSEGARIRRSRGRPAGAHVALVLLVAVLVSCSKDDFGDRTARVTVDGKLTEFQVDSCGLDGQTLFVVGRADGGRILQAVVGLEDDLETGVPESSGLTVDLGAGGIEVGAFGAEAWARQQRVGPPPGAITSARLRGSRIQVAGDAAALGPDQSPLGDGADLHRFSLDARCDDQDG